MDVINVITALEIEMLIIFHEDKYKEFKKSGKKPSVFCKEDLKMAEVKSYLIKTLKEKYDIKVSRNTIQVYLLCHSSVMKYLIDNFGSDIETAPVDADHFKATIMVCTSMTFFRWIFGFNRKIKIAGPETVKNDYRRMLMNALDE